MAHGVVTKVTERGFCFIRPADAGADVFAHLTAAEGLREGEPQPGRAVEYEVEQTPRGPRATFWRLARVTTRG